MKKRVIQPGATIEVRFSASEIEDIRKRTFADPDFGKSAMQVGTDYLMQMTLDDIEDVQGYVAAEANHAKDRRVRKRLDQIFEKLHKYLDSYKEAELIETPRAEDAADILSFPSSARRHQHAEATKPRGILHQLLDNAEDLGSDLIEVRYKDGYEEVFASVRGASYRLAAMRSSCPDAGKLRDELAALVSRKRSTPITTELRASFEVRVDTYDDFGETAYRVTFKRL